MAVLYSLLLVMIWDSTTADTISVRGGEAVQLTSDLTEAEWSRLHDLIWYHNNGSRLLLPLKKNEMKCHNRCCSLLIHGSTPPPDGSTPLPNGSLSFNCTNEQDSGKYTMNAYNKDGKNMKVKEFFLQVSAESNGSCHCGNGTGSSGGRRGSSVAVPLVLCCFLLLGFTIAFFIMKRRKAGRRRAADTQENIYVEMHQNTMKEETYWEIFNNVSTPIPNQDSQEDNIYV